MMGKEYPLAELEGVIRRVLSEGGTFVFCPKGSSMLPTVRGGVDQVVLAPLPEKLGKYQAILYKRENGQYVLHRIVGRQGDTYTMRGDNQLYNEKGIRRDQMIGWMRAVIRDGKKTEQSAWAERVRLRKILLARPFRFVYAAVKARIG